MRFSFSVSLLAIILIASSLLGFVGFNIREVKAQPATLLVGGPATATWSGHRGNRTATVGSTVRYTVNITGVTELWAFDFTLAWGMTVLEFKAKTLRVPKSTYPDGILNPTALKVYETALNEANRTAVYRLAYTQSGAAIPFTGSGCAVYLDFTVLSPGGECDVYFVDSLLSFKNGTAIPHSRTDGYFYLPTKKRVPTASFITSPATKIANKTSVTFNGGGSSDPDGAGIKSYIWTFGQDKPRIPAIESVHPYLPNTNVQFTLTHTGAIRMRVYFANITTESGKDYVRVKDKNLVQINQWSGSYGPPGVWSYWAKGDTLYINFTSDGANQFWGFKADHYGFFLQVATATTTYTYTILQSDYGATYGPYQFAIGLSVVDNEDSQSKTVTSEIQVVHPRPVARFTFSPNVTHYHPNVNGAYIFGGKTVNFDASGSYDPDPGGGIAWYAWDFGDGTKHNKSTPTTSYSFTKEGGPMSIGLTVKDTTDGLQSYFSYTLRVYNLTEFAQAYGSNGGTPPLIPPSPNWDFFYEIIVDNIIDANDLYVVGKSYY